MAKFSDLSSLGTLLGEDDKKKLQEEERKLESRKTLGNGATVYVFLDSKRRRGKTVTVISGIAHNPQVIENLAKQLKQLCGAGGTVKDREIEIQGDQLSAVAGFLEKQGFAVKRSQPPRAQ